MKQVFYINNDGLTLFHWNGRRSCAPMTFPHSKDGATALAEFLNQQPKTPTKVVIDIIEEDFRRESIRNMGPADRKFVTTRYLERHFRDSGRYTVATHQGKNPEEKHHDLVLYSGITNTEQLDQWLSPFIENDIPISGIWSVPLMVSQLKKTIMSPSTSVLVFQQDDQTLRQVLLVDGLVVTSRLTRIQHHDTSLEDFFLDETERMLHFYRRKRFIPYNQKIDVIYYHGSAVETTRLEATNDTYVITHKPLSDFLKCKYDTDIGGIALFAEKAAQLAPNTSHYQPPHILKPYRVFQANQWFIRIGVGCFTVSLLGSQLLLSQAYYHQTEAEQAVKETRKTKTAYNKRFSPIEGIIENSNEIMASVELADKLRQLTISSPLDDFQTLSMVFQQPKFSDFNLATLTWSQELTFDKKRLVVEELPPPQLSIVGQLPIDRRNTREAVNRVNDFAAAIEQSPFHSTRIVKPPLNYRPEHALQFSSEPDKIIYVSEAGNLGTFQLDVATRAEDDDDK
jgi:hypothetical protein